MLHDHKKASGGLDDFIKLDDVRVAHNLQNVDFTADALHVVNVCDFAFFQNLNCNLLIRKNMNSFLHFAKCPLAKRFSDSITPYHNSFDPFRVRDFRLVGQVKFLCH